MTLPASRAREQLLDAGLETGEGRSGSLLSAERWPDPLVAAKRRSDTSIGHLGHLLVQ